MPLNKQFLKQVQSSINAKNVNWQAKETSMLGLSDSQRKRRLGYIPKQNEPSLAAIEKTSSDKATRYMTLMASSPLALARYSKSAPSTWDWRNVNGRNFIDAVRDQGDCGSCVAFATVAALESNARIHNDVALTDISSLDMSEAQLFFCGAGRKCNVGWYIPDALSYCRNHGVTIESDFPYTDHDQACKLPADWQSKATQTKHSHRIDSIYDMKSWISERGPLITRFNVYTDFFSYGGGVYEHVSGAREGGHAVLCIGYSDSKRAWLCKNSWGKGWGESGYFWIRYGQCGINANMYAIDSFKKIGGVPVRPFMVWWEDKDFRGKKHTKYMADLPMRVCNKLVHNDKMKSLKFYAAPGWKLEIYDNSSCKKSDDWAEITFPNDPNVKVVNVPRLGKQGPSLVKPPGCYKLHYKNGLPGKVSSVRIDKQGKTGTLVWWEEKDYRGRKHTRILYPREHGRCLTLVNQDKMKSLKFYGYPGWRLQIFDKSNCSKTDDWAEVTFPNNPNLTHVSVPKIGKKGVSQVNPAGCYKFHYKNGLLGKVSSIKHFG